jgi:hypothetical protein
MQLGVVSVAPNLRSGPWLPSNEDAPNILLNHHNTLSPCQAYQALLTTAVDRKTDVLIYLHNDVTVHETGWMYRIAELFKRPEVVAVGLGGATRLGSPDLYRKPYNIWQMARSGYASNQTDAEVHGERFTGSRRVAVLDAFCMAVRVDWLTLIGGWPVAHLTHHCLDLWLACEAARHNKEIFMVGASCTHHGGGVSVSPEYAKASWLQGHNLEDDHRIPHRWLADEYRYELPIVVV